MIKNNAKQLVILILCSIFLFFCLEFIGSFVVSVLVFLKTGFFSYDWQDTTSSFLRRGIAGGTVLGIGIWIKAKLEEHKRKKNQP